MAAAYESVFFYRFGRRDLCCLHKRLQFKPHQVLGGLSIPGES